MIFAVLDTQKRTQLKTVRIIAKHTLALAVLRLLKRRFTSQICQSCQRKNSYFGAMNRSSVTYAVSAATGFHNQSKFSDFFNHFVIATC